MSKAEIIIEDANPLALVEGGNEIPNDEVDIDIDTKPPVLTQQNQRRKQYGGIVAIGETLGVKLKGVQSKEHLVDLMESKKARKPLTGIISGVELHKSFNKIVGVIMYGSFKVIIPAEFFLDIPPLENEQQTDYLLRQKKYMSTRLGSEVDFIVEELDSTEKVVIANRNKARRYQTLTVLFKKRQGNYDYQKGRILEARVVAARRAGIEVEVFGIEAFIPISEITHKRISDASKIEDCTVGDRILVKILEIERNEETKTIGTLIVSRKQAIKNPIFAALENFSVGGKYIGTVAYEDTNGVYVSLCEDLDCLCKFPAFGSRPTYGATVTVTITTIDEKLGRVFAVINYIR